MEEDVERDAGMPPLRPRWRGAPHPAAAAADVRGVLPIYYLDCGERKRRWPSGPTDACVCRARSF